MSIEDPLEEYRMAGPGEWTPESVEPMAGELMLQSWPGGECYVSVSKRRLYVQEHDALLRVPWRKVRSVGLTRHSRVKPMRWGIAFYVLGVFALILNPLLALLPVVAGGVMVARGFLSKALVIQLDDNRIPPLIVPHAKWKQVAKAIDRHKP